MRKTFASAGLVALLAAGLLTPRPASADDEEPPPKSRPTPPDTKAGKPTLALGVGFGTLYGSIDDNVSQGQYASIGPIPQVTLAYPFTRATAIEVHGTYGNFPWGTGDCGNCTASSYSLGLGLAYHLLDGTPLDPWFGAGMGYRQTHIASPGAIDTRLAGLDFRVSLGADYYLARSFGIGPFLEFSAERYLSSSNYALYYPTGNTTFQLGLRVVFSLF